jgi:hypothetical protein
MAGMTPVIFWALILLSLGLLGFGLWNLYGLWALSNKPTTRRVTESVQTVEAEVGIAETADANKVRRLAGRSAAGFAAAVSVLVALVGVLGWLGVSPGFPHEDQCLTYVDSLRGTYTAFGDDRQATIDFYENAALSNYRGGCGTPAELLPPDPP